MQHVLANWPLAKADERAVGGVEILREQTNPVTPLHVKQRKLPIRGIGRQQIRKSCWEVRRKLHLKMIYRCRSIGDAVLHHAWRMASAIAKVERIRQVVEIGDVVNEEIRQAIVPRTIGAD